ncbi:hypothetical protein RFI_01866 [Reticulomyxa filosa]|uniref:Uncharacterized protein n=1 Tax=Reticulomyxa filosa TaxID=46433 RepID=X6PAQ1_RETFI|nr:hypothetical protein RFI_01866 [Reticulomyxa filosa]|eukprot:ETO35208.1 hypothetical protein RFI_01866 [Reticulomyxa filosa]
MQMRDGNEYVMNISGRPGRPMVNFMSPYDYLFGDPEKTSELGSEQGGVFYRSIVGFRLENYPVDLLVKTHEYFKELEQKERQNKAGFNLFALPSWIRIPLLQRAIERGNCALFTSKGLVAGDVIKNATILPKYLFAKLFLKALNTWGWQGIGGQRHEPKQGETLCRPINVVYYHQAKPLGDYDFDGVQGMDKTEKWRHKNKDPSGWVSPWIFSQNNKKFRNLKLFAHAHVFLMPLEKTNPTQQSQYKGVCKTSEPWLPNWIGPIWHHD